MNDRAPTVLDDTRINTLGKVPLFAGLSALQLIRFQLAVSPIEATCDQGIPRSGLIQVAGRPLLREAANGNPTTVVATCTNQKMSG